MPIIDEPRTHDCPGHCGRRVARPRFACVPCWYRLPIELRRAITHGWRKGALSGEHRAAMFNARDWYDAHRLTP